MLLLHWLEHRENMNLLNLLCAQKSADQPKRLLFQLKAKMITMTLLSGSEDISVEKKIKKESLQGEDKFYSLY